MLFNFKNFLSTSEIIFNSFGQIYIKKNFIFKAAVKNFRFFPIKF